MIDYEKEINKLFPYSPSTKALDQVEIFKVKFGEFAKEVVPELPDGTDKAACLRAIREALHWANMSLTREQQDFIMADKKKSKNWIQSAIKKPGALRKELGVKKGKDIPEAKLKKAAKAPGKLGQRARLAETLRGMKKK